MKRETFLVMTYNELDRLVREKVAPLTNNPSRYTEWESLAEFEWNNDSSYTTKVEPGDFQSGYYQNYTKKDIMRGDKPMYITSLYGLVTFMVEHGVLEAGQYLITLSW